MHYCDGLWHYSGFATLGSTTVPSGSKATNNICRSGPLIESEKQTSHYGTAWVRNSCDSNALIWMR